MYDLHIHSNFSIYSKSSMESMVEAAIEKNLKTICFSDFIDLSFTHNNINLMFRPEDYFRDLNRVRYKYAKEIEVLSGLEIGMQPNLSKEYNQLVLSYPFDFIVMSIHSVNGINIALDNFTKSFQPLNALELYYNNVLECIDSFDDYDVLGSFDHIDRYFENHSDIPSYESLLPQITKILITLIKKGKGIEVNSSGLRHGLDYFHPKPSILKLYKELGGEIITIGSSANNTKDIGFEYKSIERALKEMGFKYIYLFRNRKKIPIKIA